MAEENKETGKDQYKYTEVVGKNNKKYLQCVIGKTQIPPEFQGQFLMINSKTGEIIHKKSKPLSDAEKQTKKDARRKVVQDKWSAQAKINKESDAKIDKHQTEIRSLKKEIVKGAVAGKDISGLQTKKNILEEEVIKLRSQKKSIPKEFRGK